MISRFVVQRKHLFLRAFSTKTKVSAADDLTQHSLDMISNQKIYEETNIYNDAFKTQLTEFCHYYQIPFLNSNIPKSTLNAAKIYYKLLQDGKKVSDRFSNSDVVKYIASIPQDSIDT